MIAGVLARAVDPGAAADNDAVTGPIGSNETAYDRARGDSAFLERFTLAYRGGDDPLDALWWHEHPESRAPSGAPPRAAELAELRRAVYAPGADRALAARYRRLQARLEQERAAVRDALAAAEQPEGRSRATEAAPAASIEPTAGSRSVPRTRAGVVVALAATAAFAAGVLVAPALGRGAAPAPSAAPTPSPTASAPLLSSASGSGSALAIFGEPQRDVDRPAVGTDARLLPQTFHRLQAMPTLGIDVYAAEDTYGDVCLVALSVEAHLTASCTPNAASRAAPLRLTVRADRYRDVFTKTGEQVDLTVTWGFFNRFTTQEAPVAPK